MSCLNSSLVCGNNVRNVNDKATSCCTLHLQTSISPLFLHEPCFQWYLPHSSFQRFKSLDKFHHTRVCVCKPLAHHVSKVVHAQAVGVFAHGVLQVVQLDLLQVLLPHHPPPALLLLQRQNSVRPPQLDRRAPGFTERRTTMHHLVVFFSVPALPQVPVLIQLWVQMGGWEDRAQANGQYSQQQLHHGSYCKTRKQRQDQISEARFWRTQPWRSSQKRGYSTQSFSSYLSQWLSSKTHSRQRSHILPPPGPNVGQQLGQTHKRSPLDPGIRIIIIIKVYPRKSMLPISSSPFSCTFSSGNEARSRQWAEPVCVCAESRDRLSRRRAKKPGRHRNRYQETEKKTKTLPASGQKHHLIHSGTESRLFLIYLRRRGEKATMAATEAQTADHRTHSRTKYKAMGVMETTAKCWLSSLKKH